MSNEHKLHSGLRVICHTASRSFVGRVCGNEPDRQGRWLVSEDFGDGWLVPEAQIEVMRNPWNEGEGHGS